MSELPQGFRSVTEAARAQDRRPFRVAGSTVGVYKNTPYLHATMFNIGPELAAVAGLTEHDTVEVYFKDRDVLVRKGGSRKLLMRGKQLRVSCPALWEVDKSFRVAGSASADGTITFRLPPGIKSLGEPA